MTAQPLRRPVVDLTEEEARRALVLKWGTMPPGVLPAWVAEMDYALDPVVQEFLHLVLSREGQEIVVKDGYYPLPAKIVQEELAKLH